VINLLLKALNFSKSQSRNRKRLVKFKANVNMFLPLQHWGLLLFVREAQQYPFSHLLLHGVRESKELIREFLSFIYKESHIHTNSENVKMNQRRQKITFSSQVDSKEQMLILDILGDTPLKTTCQS